MALNKDQVQICQWRKRAICTMEEAGTPATAATHIKMSTITSINNMFQIRTRARIAIFERLRKTKMLLPVIQITEIATGQAYPILTI